MFFQCEQLSLRTTAPIEILDITSEIKQLFASHRFRNGQLTITSPHTTAFIALNEAEPMLKRDMVDFLARLVPRDAPFRHNRNPIDGRLNAHSHLLGLFMNASETILVADSELLLGTWQSVFFVELDGPRDQRMVRVQLAGEL